MLAACATTRPRRRLSRSPTSTCGPGQWGLAREVFLLLVDRYPTHPRTADAYRWLIRHHCSSEARRRHEMGQFLMLTAGGSGAAAGPGDAAEAEKPKPDDKMPKADDKTRPRKAGEVPGRRRPTSTVHPPDPAAGAARNGGEPSQAVRTV